MKKKILSLFVALVANVAVQAQQISVVSPSGATTLYRTLGEAINGADPGSVVYLPGGGFTISDEVKITKKLTIIGIGHKTNGDNADGSTIISGNLWFNEGSSNSAILGCYITGNVNIGEGGAEVNDILIKYCNLNSVQVKNAVVTGTFINQNYIRSTSNFGGSSVTINNNIINRIVSVNLGTIKNNCILGALDGPNVYNSAIHSVYNTIFTGNIFYGSYPFFINLWGANCSGNEYIYNLYCRAEQANFYFTNDSISTINATASDIFINNNNWSISPASDFHFKDEYKQYESQVGIYAGSGFNDKQMAPVPYITFKDVDEETDAAGKLKVRIRVKASE